MQASDIGIVTFAPYKILETNSANKFYDYLSCGLPVLINYKGWQADFLKEFDCGLSSQPSSIQEFANNIVKLSKDKFMSKNMGQNARNACVSLFDRKKLAKQVSTYF